MLTGGELADGAETYVCWLQAGELGVQVGIVLAVVADEQPLDVGQVPGEFAQAAALVLLPAAEPAGVGGAQSVSSIAPWGMPWRAVKRWIIGNVFHAPVEMKMMGAPGCSASRRW